MLQFAVLFGLGAGLFHRLPGLPAVGWCAAWALLFLLIVRARRLRPVAVLVAGFGWSHLYALATEPPRLPGDDRVIEAIATGTVDSLVDTSGGLAHFLFAVTRLEGGEGAHFDTLQGLWRLRLSWRDPPALAPGDRWRLRIRLRHAHGYATPGAWDYEGWLYWQGVRYTAYVRGEAAENLQGAAADACCPLLRERSRLSAAIEALPISAFSRGVIRAITIGDRGGLDRDGKALFRATGTSHLMAISGLHIGFAAAIGLVVAAAVWRRIPWCCSRLPARVAGAFVGLLVAAAYAALAGFGLPTQRALIMLAVAATALIGRRECHTLNALAVAAVGVLVWHPPSVLAAGFWLSFGAVLVIVATLSAIGRSSHWRSLLLIQAALGIGLFPLLALFGLPASSVSPVANLVLVPVFALLVVPLSLLGTLLVWSAPAVADWWFIPVGALIDLCHTGLAWLAGSRWALSSVSGASGVCLLAWGIGAGLLMSPPGVPGRRLALPLLLVSWLPSEPDLGPGEFRLHVLDVGQGLSTVVETRSHTLVFDTGPAFPSGFSTAQAVLSPFLAGRGRKHIDRLLLSHGDIDHAGGTRQLMAHVSIAAVLSGEPHRVTPAATQCHAGQRWSWDGVAFEVLHPPPDHPGKGNNASCVLRIGNAAGSALLTGDIEQSAERALVRLYAGRLASRVLVAPHHGSRSSSSEDLVGTTRPAFVVYSSGWANRYGFPAPSVRQRWDRAGAVGLDTATSGSITFTFHADGHLAPPLEHRRLSRRFWSHTGGSAVAGHGVSSSDR